MTISLTRMMDAINESRIAKYWIGYFRENFRGETNERLVEVFRASGSAKADIARKLDRRPEQITRWLSAPCNLEIDTISDLALSLGLVPTISFEKIGEDRSNKRVHNFVAHYEPHTVSKDTRTGVFVCQPTHDASTDQLGSTRVPTKANVREVVPNA
jgi:hypothetical protein